MTPADAGAVAAIYNHYVLHTVVTFEEEPVTADEMSRRIDEVRAASLPWFVAERAGAIAGYAYASRWRARSGYRFSSEVTVYLAPEQGRRGIGSVPTPSSFPCFRGSGLHAAIGGIALTNDSSVALHEKFGFKKVAHFEQTGFKFNRWIDVGYWQLIL